MNNCIIALVAVFNERRDHSDEFTAEHDFRASRLGASFTSHGQQVKNATAYHCFLLVRQELALVSLHHCRAWS